MMQTFTYRRGAERPGITLPWQEETTQDVWTNLDLTGYTFVLTLTPVGSSVATLTKSTNITGGDGEVEILWAADELDIAEIDYRLDLRATSGSLDRDYSPASPVVVVIVP